MIPFSIFPEKEESKLHTTGECLKVLEKFTDKLAGQSHDVGRASWSTLIGVLTQGMRSGLPVPDKYASLRAYDALYRKNSLEVGEIIEYMKNSPTADYFGELFMMRDHASAKAGQFFTPEHVVKMMVEITLPENAGDEVYRVLDPACGAGRMLIYTMMKHPKAICYGIDIDMDVIRCSVLTCWIYFPDRAWGFLRANSLARRELSDSMHPHWDYANKWEQPAFLLEWADPEKECSCEMCTKWKRIRLARKETGLPLGMLGRMYEAAQARGEI